MRRPPIIRAPRRPAAPAARRWSILVTFGTAAAACAWQTSPAPDPGPGPPGTEEEKWISLFNGKDLTGWTPKFTGLEPGENYKNTFRVEDGVLVVAYDEYERFDGRFGHLFFEHEHARYVLRLEYRFFGEQARGAPGWAFRNSGVMIHGQTAESMARDQDFPVSIEVQLLGGDGEHTRSTGNLCTPGTHVVMDGELVTRHCTNSSSETFHGDEWVGLEIEVRGDEVIRHKIDGRTVLEYGQPQLDEDDPHARVELERRGGVHLIDRGTISLQAESHPCAFRNIRLRPLEGGGDAGP